MLMETINPFSALTARPPTPPRDAGWKSKDNTIEKASLPTTFLHSPLDTPNDSPNSSDYFPPSGRVHKRVDFQPDHSRFSPLVTSNSPPSGKQKRRVPPSKECKASKSILKPYNSAMFSDPASESDHHDRPDFPNMLEDCARQLASASHSTRLDAYKTLNGCLKTYKDLPDPQSMEDKLPLLTDFIQRDLSAKMVVEKDITDTQLKLQALKLAVIILASPSLAEKFQVDFQIFMFEYAIHGIENLNSSKVLVGHYMQILSRQNFRASVITTERITRLLHTLGEITTNFKGNAVVGQRLVVYHRLLQQAKSTMTIRVNDWIDHLFAGLHSSLAEIRSRALDFGVEASLSLGTTAQVSRAVIDLINITSPEGRKFADVLNARLNEMVGSKEEILHVPRIWTVTILFLRSRPHQLARWEHLRTWLSILQRCFNSGDRQVKIQANHAWNYLIFVINPSSDTGPQMLTMLQQPIMAQLKATYKANTKHAESAKQSARASYVTLLYYSFRPGSTPETYDRFWKEYLTRLKDQPNSNFAFEVLTYLLGGQTQNMWNYNRICEPSPIQAEELPHLDPKWIRSRADLILELFDHFWPTADWSPLKDDEAWVWKAWGSFTKALGEAGSKEIKVSGECMVAMAQMTSSLKRLWALLVVKKATTSPHTTSNLLRLPSLVSIAAANLGPLPFAEKSLVQSVAGKLEVAETPSSRQTRILGPRISAILVLIDTLASSPEDEETSNSLLYAQDEFLDIALRSATSRLSKLKILRDMVPLSLSDTALPPRAKIILWQVITKYACEALEMPKNAMIMHESRQLFGQDFREAAKLLEMGSNQEDESIMKAWIEVLMQLNTQVISEAGIGGSVLAVIEPLASSMVEQNAKRDTIWMLRQTTALIQCATWPTSRKELEQAQRCLWGAVSTTSKSLSVTVYDKLYDLVDRTLLATYRSSDLRYSAHTVDLIRSVIRLVETCPLSQAAVCLKRIQRGLAIWIEDDSGYVGPGHANSRTLLPAVIKLATAVAKMIESLPNFNNNLLVTLEILIGSCLSSRHRTIINQFVPLWNSTFGSADNLEYSESLQGIPLRLSTITELLLPGLQAKEGSVEVDSTPFDFVDSQQELNDTTPQALGKNHVEQDASAGPHLAVPPRILPNVTETSLHKRTANTPERRVTAKPKTTPTARLRHDDSQIQFAAIESSPLAPGVMDSQLLTDKQKEVKERQHEEAAAMFADLRSSPRPATTRPMVDIRSTDGQLPEVLNEEPISPILPLQNEIMDSFLGSSPTPRSQEGRVIEGVQRARSRSPSLVRTNGIADQQTTDIPSSPPECAMPRPPTDEAVMQGQVHETMEGITTLPEGSTEFFGDSFIGSAEIENMLDQSKTAGLQPRVAIGQKHNITAAPTLPEHHISVDVPDAPDASSSTSSIPIEPLYPLISAKREEQVGSDDTEKLSRPENPPEPISEVEKSREPSNDTEMLDDQIITSTYQEISADPDDLISAQLAKDMEFVLSQSQDAETTPAVSPVESVASSDSKKRKRTLEGAVVSSKKRKPGRPRKSSRAQSTKMKVSTANENEEMHDSITLTPRVSSQHHRSSPQSSQLASFQNDAHHSAPSTIRSSSSAGSSRRSSSIRQADVKDLATTGAEPDDLHAEDQSENDADMKQVLGRYRGVVVQVPVYQGTRNLSHEDGEEDGMQDTPPEPGAATTSARNGPKAQGVQTEVIGEAADVAATAAAEELASDLRSSLDQLGAELTQTLRTQGCERPLKAKAMLGMLKQLRWRSMEMQLDSEECAEIMDVWMDLGTELRAAKRRGGK